MTVLVVDDNEETAAIVANAVEAIGYDTEVVNSGSAALSLLWSRMFQAMIVDLRMPAPNGFDIARRVRELGIKTPVLAISGWPLVEDPDGLFADVVIQKPFRIADLAAIMERAVSGT